MMRASVWKEREKTKEGACRLWRGRWKGGGATGAKEGEEEEKVEEEEEEEEEDWERLAQREGRRRWAGQAGREKFLRAGRGEGVEPAGDGGGATASYGETNELTFRSVTPLLRKREVISGTLHLVLRLPAVVFCLLRGKTTEC